jgi:hypothetical protein
MTVPEPVPEITAVILLFWSGSNGSIGAITRPISLFYVQVAYPIDVNECLGDCVLIENVHRGN